MIDREQAAAIARADLARMKEVEIVDVELDEIDGGWQVRWVVEPTRPTMLGAHHLIIGNDGVVHRYPSRVSPRMARESFRPGPAAHTTSTD